MRARPAAGGGWWVEVAPERLEHWLARFAARHGVVSVTANADRVDVVAADQTRARCTVPFPPLPVDTAAPYGGLIAHALVERRVGVMLVRLGGFAAGVFDGDRLVAAKVGTRPVHGRSAAGGQSQHRFARRRAGQAAVALAAAADNAARVLGPVLDSLDAVVVGGDRRAVETVLADPRLARLRALRTGPLLDVPDPRHKVLRAAGGQLRAVRVVVLPITDYTKDHVVPGE